MKIAKDGIAILCQKCGGNEVATEPLGESGNCFVVLCKECGHCGPVGGTRGEALAAWASENRAAERKLIVRIGELDAALAAEKAAHQKLRADAQTARAILADIDTGAAADPVHTVVSVGNAFQLLDLALEAGAEQADGEEAPKC